MAHRMTRKTCFGVAVVLLLQGCYVKWGDEIIVGQEDTAFPGASIEKGCVVEIDRSRDWYPPGSDKVLFKELDPPYKLFDRWAELGSKLQVGKCYEWKLGFRDAWWPADMMAVSSDTVREIERR